MSDVHIAGTGIWFPEDIITNDEIVSSFNSYVAVSYTHLRAHETR